MSDRRGAKGGRRDWTRRPAQPIWYFLWQRWADRRAGRRDGKAGLEPAAFVPDGKDTTAQAIVNTPTTRLLYTLYRQAVAVEGMENVTSRAELAGARVHAIAELAVASDRLHVDEQLLTESEKGPDFDRRTLGDNERPEEVRRARRQREFDELRWSSRDARGDAYRNLAEVDAVVKQHQMAEDSLQWVSRLREQRIHAHYERRASTYWRSFVQASETKKANELCQKYRPGLPGERVRPSIPESKAKRVTP